MSLSHLNSVITGATGGIGAAVAAGVLHRGGKAVLTARDPHALSELARAIDPSGERTLAITADITRAEDRQRLCDAAKAWEGGVNALINIAGIPGFGMFASEPAEKIEHAFEVNALAPLHLCRSLLPHLMRQPQAYIVNVGSVFGAIAWPGHAVYSATKFALRGFSEALRRELVGTTVRVHYLAPRATRTKFNAGAVEALNVQFGVAMDPPELVADSLCRMLATGRVEVVIGWPEKFFARLNALLPRIVDRALAKRLPAIQRHAAERNPASLQVQSVPRSTS